MWAWFSAFILAPAADAAPIEVAWQSRLLDAVGHAVHGPHDVTITLYEGGTSSIRWRRTYDDVPFADGFASIRLAGAGQVGGTLDDSHFDGPVDLGVAVDGAAEMTPRERLADVPSAQGGPGSAFPLVEVLRLVPVGTLPPPNAAYGQIFALDGLGHDPGASVLHHFDLEGFPIWSDNGGYGFSQHGDAHVTDVDSRWGGRSVYLDGVGDSLEFGAQGYLDLNNNPFTVEVWAKNTHQAGEQTIIGCWHPSVPRWLFGLEGSRLVLYTNDGSGEVSCKSAVGSVAAGVWTHLAATRDYANDVRLFVDGQVVATCTMPQAIQCPVADPRVGSDYGGVNPYAGYLDELRVHPTQAYWQGPFTPPTFAYVDGGVFYMARDGSIQPIVPVVVP
jgi:hypothetical protein